jgi:hypothetical protein
MTGFWVVGDGEQATAKTKADPCGMTNKRTGNGKGKMAKANAGILRCSQNDNWMLRSE